MVGNTERSVYSCIPVEIGLMRQDEDAVGKAFSKLLVSADKRDQLACKTRPLDYLDNPRNREDLFKR
jgi:hypothetical protein